MAYKEYYEELPMAMMHLDHCVDSLRRVLMCLPNDGLILYDWSPNLRGPQPRFEVMHECFNWEKFDDWARDRRVDLYDTKAVVHPIYGIEHRAETHTVQLTLHRSFLSRRTRENLGAAETWGPGDSIEESIT